MSCAPNPHPHWADPPELVEAKAGSVPADRCTTCGRRVRIALPKAQMCVRCGKTAVKANRQWMRRLEDEWRAMVAS